MKWRLTGQQEVQHRTGLVEIARRPDRASGCLLR